MGRFHRHSDGLVHTHEDETSPGETTVRFTIGDRDLSSRDRPSSDLASRDVGDHSGYEQPAERVAILERILSENDRCAEANRDEFARATVRVVNLMSSPGAGKTALLRATLERIGSRRRIGIIEGDIETAIDADRLRGFGAAISLVNTANGFGGECHLDATMVRQGMSGLDLDALDLVVIENVGNLVCPAEFGVGESARAMVYSVTEGEEKPLKYPVMFRAVEVVVVNKIDLLPYLEFDLDLFLANLAKVNPTATPILTSARTGEGVASWCRWLEGEDVFEP